MMDHSQRAANFELSQKFFQPSLFNSDLVGKKILKQYTWDTDCDYLLCHHLWLSILYLSNLPAVSITFTASAEVLSSQSPQKTKPGKVRYFLMSN